MARCVSEFYQQHLRSSTRATFVGRVARVDILCGGRNENILAMSTRRVVGANQQCQLALPSNRSKRPVK